MGREEVELKTVESNKKVAPMISRSAEEQLDLVQYLYLRELSEPHDNSLRLVVEEATTSQFSIDRLHSSHLQGPARGWRPIESAENCRVFELYWKRYAAYLVTEELVASNAASGYDDEVYVGRRFREYSKSHFLAHIQRDTGGHIEDVRHFKVICLNHLIDIAAYAPPEICRLDPQPGSQDATQ